MEPRFFDPSSEAYAPVLSTNEAVAALGPPSTTPRRRSNASSIDDTALLGRSSTSVRTSGTVSPAVATAAGTAAASAMPSGAHAAAIDSAGTAAPAAALSNDHSDDGIDLHPAAASHVSDLDAMAAASAAEADLERLVTQFESFRQSFWTLHGQCEAVMDPIRRAHTALRARRLESERKLKAMRERPLKIVRLNVGGTHFDVSEHVLRQHQGCFFDVMLDEYFTLDRDETGAIFIDRDPHLFREVLHFLRTGDVASILRRTAHTTTTIASGGAAGVDVPPEELKPNAEEVRRLAEEARFYGLDLLYMQLSTDRLVWRRQGEHHLVDGDIPSPRCFTAAELVGDSAVYLFGGCTADDKFFDAFYALRVDETSAMVPVEPEAPAVAAATAAGQSSHVGGSDAAAGGTAAPMTGSGGTAPAEMRRVQHFSWTRIRPKYGTAPAPRSGHTMNHIDGHLVVMFGNNSSAMVPGCHAFNIYAGGWTAVVSVGEPIAPRSGHTVTVVDGKMYLIGGKQIFPTMRTYNDLLVGEFNPKNCNITWKPAPVTTELERRAYHTAVAHQKQVFVFGGIVNNVYCRDLCSYDTVGGVWRTYAQGNPPLYNPTHARSGHIAVVHGSEMYVFGSYSEEGNEMVLQCLDLETLAWRTVRTTAAGPPRRAAPSGVILPADVSRAQLPQLLVFGGFDLPARRCFNEVYTITI